MQITIDLKELNRGLGKLGYLKDQGADQAMVNAINRTVAHTKSLTQKLVPSLYEIKPGEVLKTVTITRAQRKRLKGELRSLGGTIAIDKFKFTPKRPIKMAGLPVKGRESVSVRIEKAKPLKKILTKPGAFVQKFKGKLRVVSRQKGNKNHFKILHTVSVPQMIEKMNKMFNIQDEIGDFYLKRLAHEVEFQFKKAGAK